MTENQFNSNKEAISYAIELLIEDGCTNYTSKDIQKYLKDCWYIEMTIEEIEKETKMEITTTNRLNQEQAEKLAAIIQEEMGEKYHVNISLHGANQDYPIIGLWTVQRPLFPGASVHDQIVTTFDSTRSWHLFKLAAITLVDRMNEKVQEQALIQQAKTEQPYDEKKWGPQIDPFLDEKDPDMVLHVNSDRWNEHKTYLDFAESQADQDYFQSGDFVPLGYDETEAEIDCVLLWQ